MAARPTAATTQPLAARDLTGCTDVAGIAALFRKLRYPVEAPVVEAPVEVEDLPGRLRDGIAARYPLAYVGGRRAGDPALEVALFALSSASEASALARGISQTWTRRFPGWHLFVFAVPGASAGGQSDLRQLIFVNARRLGEGADVRIKLHKLVVDRQHVTRHDLETLNRIAMDSPDLAPQALYQAQCAAFDVERMTDTFYKEYARRFREAMERIHADNKGVAAFYEPERLHTFTQRLFGRLMFLYFLQKKGALNRNPNFITTWYERAAADDENFYGSVLEPLFFDTLNRPREDGRSVKFGQIPYLNGGLFAADEDDLRGGVYLDNAIFDAKSDEGLLYFLNNHNFTVEEDTPLEVQVALDPEMLGKVFENLLETEERGKSGTFYTPRPVVAFMCREALASYLSHVEGLDNQRLSWLLDEAETGDPARDAQGAERLTYHNLSYSLHQRIEQALLAVRVLDPAVGSGAFPLGMLALLVGVRRALYRIRENRIEPQSRLVEDWKRGFIRDCLYGVDIRREAIEIARLRLWLSLVVDADPFEMEPLPNLDYKLMDGDSLIETFDGVPIYPTRPESGPAQQTLLGGEQSRTLIQRLHELQDAFFQPEETADRAALRREIRETEVALVEQTLRERQVNERGRLDIVIRKLANLGGKPAPRDLAAEQVALSHSIEMTDAALADLRAGKPLPFFLYRLHFAGVFAEKDGFDIVIANPPYVRHEKVPQTTLAALKAAYRSVQHGMADLYVYFYARALELLHDGGTLCFISSNKFFRAGYGKGLRNAITGQTSVRIVIDFGDFPVFDAAAYPCIVITDKGAPRQGHVYHGLTAGPSIELDRLDEELAAAGQAVLQNSEVQPPNGSRTVNDLLQRLLNSGVPLRGFHNGKMYYGIKTGLNEAFVIGADVRNQLLQQDPKSEKVIKPFLRGRDASRYQIRNPRLYLLYIGWHCDISQYAAVRQYLEQFKRPLAERTEVKSGRIPWFALSRYAADYYQEFSKPKVLTVRFGLASLFAFDDKGFYCNNAMSFFSPSTKWLTAILNSSVCSFCLISVCPTVQNGYSQFFLSNIEMLPIVGPSLADQRRLSDLVDQLQALGGQGPQAEAMEREVDEIVYHTYSLTPDEIKIIEDWHAERRALLGSGKRRAKAAVEIDDGAEDQEAEP